MTIVDRMTKYKIFLKVEEKETLSAEIINGEFDSPAHKRNNVHYELEIYLEIGLMDEKFGCIVQFVEDVGGAAIGLFLRKSGMTTVELCKDRLTIQQKLLEILQKEFKEYGVEVTNFLIYSITILDRDIINRLSRLEVENTGKINQ